MQSQTFATLEALMAIKKEAARLKFTPHARFCLKTGHFISQKRGHGLEFRDIVEGGSLNQDARRIAWRITARVGKPHLKTFQEELEQTVFIIVDLSHSMHFGTRIAFKSVVASHLAAWTAWYYFLNGARVGGLVFSEMGSQFIAPSHKTSHLTTLFKAIEVYANQTPSNPTPFVSKYESILKRVMNKIPPRSVYFFMSDGYHLSKTLTPYFSYLSKKNALQFYHIADPLELNSPPPGLYALTNGQETIAIDFENAQNRKIYETYCKQKLDGVQDYFRHLNIASTIVTAKDNLAEITEKTAWGIYHDR